MRFRPLSTALNTANLLIMFITMINVAPAFARVPDPAPCHAPAVDVYTKEDFPPPATGDRGFDVLSYDLDLVLDPGPPSISGRIDMGLRALHQGLQLIHLDLVDNLDCLEVKADGVPLYFEHSGDSLMVHLLQPLNAAETETLSIAWEGRPLPHGSFRAGLMFRRHHAGTLQDPSDDMPIITNVSETWSAHSWWPCKDHPADKALVSLSATVPDTLSLVSNGTLMGIEPSQPGWTTYKWREAYPLPTYLVSVAASNYSVWTEDCLVSSSLGPDQNIPLGFHVFPHDLPDGQIDLAITCQAMEFMTDLAGPYPFDGEKYDQVEIFWAGAMEHPTVTSLPSMFFTGDGQFETLLVHELSHHWFGNSLTPAAWKDIWLNEGFARYCEALWLESSMGREAYVEFMGIIGLDHNQDMFVGDGLLGDPDPIMPNLLVYDKGAWLLHSLRMLLGDQDFFNLLATYANETQLVHGSVVTADFIRVAEQIAGRSLHHFFDPWLNTETVAKLHTDVQVQPQGQTGTVRFNFQQLQEVWLEMAIPVSIHCGPSETSLTLVMKERTQEFTMELDCPIDSVTVDPEGMVFMERADAGARFMDVIGPWPNPWSSQGAEFRIYLLESADVSMSIYDARGRRIHQGGPGLLETTGPAHEVENTPHIWSFSPNEITGLTSGVYWFEFRTGGHRSVRKTTFVH